MIVKGKFVGERDFVFDAPDADADALVAVIKAQYETLPTEPGFVFLDGHLDDGTPVRFFVMGDMVDRFLGPIVVDDLPGPAGKLSFSPDFPPGYWSAPE